MGENQGTAEEGSVGATAGYLGVKITLEDARSLLKYSEESTRVLAVFVTPSLSIARVIGTLQVFVTDGVPPHLIVGTKDAESDQIKFRLSDCEFEYGDFRHVEDEDSAARQFLKDF
jgi:hypothetical protein